jgi:membrane-associated protease RseP (regulator of RpoE activity)
MSNPGQLTNWMLEKDVEEVMDVSEAFYDGPFLCFRGSLKMGSEDAFAVIHRRAKDHGLVPYLSREREGVILKFTVRRAKKSSPRIGLHLGLFLATVLSTLIAGAVFVEEIAPARLLAHPLLLARGVPFSFTLLIILGLHELGHYAVSRRYGLPASLPFFIPAPTILGTLGAVIVSRSPFTSRKSLFDVAVAGPLASFILSIIAVVIGLSGARLVQPVMSRGSIGIGSSLLFSGLAYLRFGHIPEGYTFTVGSMAFAGWVGLLVTAINLFPLSQLDGGHITYALFGTKHRTITRAALAVMFLMGVIFWPGWLIWVFLILMMGTRHAPPLDDLTPLDPARRLLGWAAYAILILCFVPVPMQAL